MYDNDLLFNLIIMYCRALEILAGSTARAQHAPRQRLLVIWKGERALSQLQSRGPPI
jgi:hypothetical protein